MTPAGDSVWSTLPRDVSGSYARRGGGGELAKHAAAGNTKAATGAVAARAGPAGIEPATPGFGALLATPALQPLLIFKHLALSEQRRRRWTTPSLALILALR